MRSFARLLDRLFYTYGNHAKAKLLLDYLRATPDPDRGYAIAIIAGTLELPGFKRSLVRDLIASRVDPVLVDLSYDYVGELAETVAHLWPSNQPAATLPRLAEIVAALQTLPKAKIIDYAAARLDEMTSAERWAFLKLGSRGGLRIGVSARFLKQVLAEFGNRDIQEIEAAWHAVAPPYAELFAWLEGRGDAPASGDLPFFHPVMLAQPLEAQDQAKITPQAFAAEWKYDGIRVQIVARPGGKAIFSRTGDDISAGFPDLMAAIDFDGVLDGELLVAKGGRLGSFNDLQQRLNRKKPDRQLIARLPARIIVYDMLWDGRRDLRGLTFMQRRACLETWIARVRPPGFDLSSLLAFTDFSALSAHRLASAAAPEPVEGLMLKRRDSPYLAGRPAGLWFKWKRDPRVVDAVLMYAQRGHGKRSSYYSDYTFGLWQEGTLLPIGKAYFGFTDAELKQLDQWIRHNTIKSFGPVREVAKALVFEVAFDAVNRSARHKSGFALRFPRISRIRWDKPANEADQMAALDALLDLQAAGDQAL